MGILLSPAGFGDVAIKYCFIKPSSTVPHSPPPAPRPKSPFEEKILWPDQAIKLHILQRRETEAWKMTAMGLLCGGALSLPSSMAPHPGQGV